MAKIGADFGAKSSYIQPEILKMDRQTIDKFIQQEPRLKVFAHGLDDILRRKAHTGTEGEEKIIADASLMADSPDNVFGASNADFPYPDVTLADGKTVKLDKAAFALYRASPREAIARKFSRRTLKG